jgi:acyl-CoA thioesterase
MMQRETDSTDPRAARIRDFNECAFACLTGMEVALTPEGGIRVVMDPDGKWNAIGTIHGGAIFALADQAFGIAANLGDSSQVAVSASIQYLAPATGRLEAVARLVEETALTSVYEVEVSGEGRRVAVFRGVGYKVGEKAAKTEERPKDMRR